MVSHSRCNIQRISVEDGYSFQSDEHQLPIIRWVLIDGLNELGYRTSHQVGLIDLVVVADGGHSPCNPSSTTAFHSPHGLCYNFTVEELTASIWIGNLMSVG